MTHSYENNASSPTMYATYVIHLGKSPGGKSSLLFVRGLEKSYLYCIGAREKLAGVTQFFVQRKTRLQDDDD